MKVCACTYANVGLVYSYQGKAPACSLAFCGNGGLPPAPSLPPPPQPPPSPVSPVPSLPPPSLPPPSLPPPPVALSHLLTVSLIAAGSVEAFDAARRQALRERWKSVAPNATSVAIRVAPASVAVHSRLVFRDEPAARIAEARLLSLSSAELGSALDIEVESVSNVSYAIIPDDGSSTIVVESVESISDALSGDAADVTSSLPGTIALCVLGGIAISWLSCCTCSCVHLRRQRRKQREEGEAADTGGGFGPGVTADPFNLTYTTPRPRERHHSEVSLSIYTPGAEERRHRRRPCQHLMKCRRRRRHRPQGSVRRHRLRNLRRTRRRHQCKLSSSRRSILHCHRGQPSRLRKQSRRRSQRRRPRTAGRLCRNGCWTRWATMAIGAQGPRMKRSETAQDLAALVSINRNSTCTAPRGRG